MVTTRNLATWMAACATGLWLCGCQPAGNGGNGSRNDNGTATPNDNSGTVGGNDNAGDGGNIDVPGPVLLGDPGAARIFFSDLTSGPSRGGYNDAGAVVTLYGNGFGDERGAATVTVGGGLAADYLAWGDTRIAFQLGSDARTGDIVVHTGAGDSNAVPFVVREGGIFCVSLDGNDQAGGAFGDCWASLPLAVDAVGPGDIIYVMDGVTAETEHRFNAALSIETDATADAPIALVAWPGAAVTIGVPEGLEMGLRAGIGVPADYWVIAGLRFRGVTSAIELDGTGVEGWRVVGNDISCPDGDGQTGCFAASLATYVRFLGNEVHDTGIGGASKQYHAVYFTTDAVHVEVGWNYIHDNNTCRAIQFHSSPLCAPDCGPTDTTGFNQYDLIVHDNVIHGDACDGIVFATVDPSQGPVEAYNNVIYEVGRGPDPPDGAANYAGIYVPGYLNNGPEGTGVVEVYNNTIYDCGAQGGSAAGAIARDEYSPGLTLRLRNNIIVQPAGQPYLTADTHPDLLMGENNLWFGDGPGPAGLTGNIDADPRFVDGAAFDFRQDDGSPAIDAGIDIGLGWDIIGANRPEGEAVDLGAFER